MTAWRRPIVGVPVVLILALAALWFVRGPWRDFVDTDRCLDAGGDWDAEHRQCRHDDEFNPPGPMPSR